MEAADSCNDHIDRLLIQHKPKRRVRIAILDTGCDPGEPCIVSLPRAEDRLSGKHWKDWVSGKVQPIDEDHGAHGTSTVALLLRVARHAEVFVGRIARDKHGLRGATNNIVEVR